MADFIGQANVVPARVEAVNAGTLALSIGGRVFDVRAVKGGSFARGDGAVLVVRPENLTLRDEGEEAPFTGTVRTRTFLGGRMEYDVALACGPEVLAFDPYLPGKRMYAEGESIRLSFDPAVAVALKA
mgnify:CR=1 FL=1